MKWNEVTWYSKLLALMVLIVAPCAGFYLGMQYQEAMTAVSPSVNIMKVPAISSPSTSVILPPSLWLTYTHGNHEFTFQYPPDASLDTSTPHDPNPKDVSINIPINVKDAKTGATLQDIVTLVVTVRDNLKRLSASQFFASQQFATSTVGNTGPMIVNGMQGYKYTLLNAPVLSNYIYLAKNNVMYEISYDDMSSFPGVDDHTRLVYNNILQTIINSFTILQAQ